MKRTIKEIMFYGDLVDMLQCDWNMKDTNADEMIFYLDGGDYSIIKHRETGKLKKGGFVFHKEGA